MHRVQPFHALYLDYDFAAYDKIRPMLPDEMPFVEHWNPDLTEIRKIRIGKFNAKRLLIGGLEQAWAEMSVDFDSTSDDRLCQRVVLIHLGASASVVCDQ
jgi:hypothetical protein